MEAKVGFPAHRREIRIGYARVSTGGQNLERQLDALKAAGCRRIFADKKSGKTAERPELQACHAFLAEGDTLVVPSLDRYGRSLADLIAMVGELGKREIGFTSLHENLDTTTPGGRLVFHVFAALAEFIRELIVAGTREGSRSPRLPGCSAGARARCTTTSPTCVSCGTAISPWARTLSDSDVAAVTVSPVPSSNRD
ncbi:recombinase family protein [Microbispora triticiradicis]|uniref:recombinase family protein n=1 Tax=Microbispora triticiradicis TaxID=2200763 RepID=UPI0027DB1D22|nr:recombinase family protein [Microbispora triticiradicis]MBO4275507.1 recombinase family protein [Microbispora triticiradicis]